MKPHTFWYAHVYYSVMSARWQICVAQTEKREKKPKKRKLENRKQAKKSKKKAGSDEELMEDSDDLDEGEEVDYISGSSRSPLLLFCAIKVTLVIALCKCVCLSLPCLGPSSCLGIGGHWHGHQESPHVSVSCTLITICNGCSCPLFNIISPASPWSSLTSVSGNDAMYEDVCTKIVSSDYMAEVLYLPSFDFFQETTCRCNSSKLSIELLVLCSLQLIRIILLYNVHLKSV